MISDTKTIIFLGNGRCYHTLDWFRSAQRLRPEKPPVLVTDLVESESYEKLIKPTDLVGKLFILDRYLIKKQSRIGNVWRNILKLLVLPIQIIKLRKLVKKFDNPVIHAHAMYYIALARFSSCKYIATPQGSELLIRPYRSYAYKLFSQVSFSRASIITVDSNAMRESLVKLFGLDATIIQNGIDIDAIGQLHDANVPRQKVVSIRGFDPNYQIGFLLDTRNRTIPDLPIHFCYPFIEMGYKTTMSTKLIDADIDLGRLPRFDLYRLLLATKLVISIPVSDSSPRSVYEAIFCGCFVAVTNGDWVSQLPACMASRVIVVNLQSKTWLQDSIDYADSNINRPYVPSSHALDLFDQKRSMSRCYEEMFYARMEEI
ncbi:MAG: glycosyltransferase [Candidatus Scalindua sp.]